MVGQGANGAGLSILLAQGSRVPKIPALLALGGLEGRVGGRDAASRREEVN